MKTLYLHIGTPKTATTAIQRFCEDNQSILNTRGYCYPDMPFRYPDICKWRNAHFLVNDVMSDGARSDYIEENSDVTKAFEMVDSLFEQYDNVILSDESVWNHGCSRKNQCWEYIARELKKGRYIVKVIVYLRRQDEFAYSWWNQQIKEGMHRSSLITWEEMTEKLPVIKLDYYDMLNRIAGYVGKENIIVRRFDRTLFYGGTIYADFLHAIGLRYSKEYQVLQNTRNISLSKSDNEIKRVLNTLPELDDKSNRLFRRLLSECSALNPDDRQYDMFSEEEMLEFMSRFEESNRKVAREYLGIDGDLFPSVYRAEGKWGMDDPGMLQDIIMLVGKLAIYSMEENEKLRKELGRQKRQIDWLQNILYHPIKAVSRKTKKLVRKSQDD